MPYLFDTKIFLRLATSHDPASPLALQAFQELRTRRETLCYTPQVLAEFWSVGTRSPSARGGLGLSPADADRRARVIERYFRLLPDSLATYREWRQLIVRYAVVGAQAHDARLVASMKAYSISHLVTFNVEHFRRYPDITVIEPQHLRPT